MVSVTNETPSGSTYPVTIGGNFKLDQIDESGTTYTFTCKGLHTSDFDFEIDKTDAETSGNIDLEKVAAWLFAKVKNCIASYNVTGGTDNMTFDNASGTTVDVSGVVDVVHNGNDGDDFELTIEGLEVKNFDGNVPVSEAGGNSAYPNPGHVFRWLMKKLKENLCPECM
jgi:hypothetical protein